MWRTSTMEKVIDGARYTGAVNTISCAGCVGDYNDALCDKLRNDDYASACTHNWTISALQPPRPTVSTEGIKYDDDKLKYSLIPSYALEAVAKNLTAGLKKYPHRDNWQLVNNAEERYLDALMRHLEQHRRGEIFDTDNIDPTTTHLSAVAVNCMFLLEFLLNPNLNTNGINDKSK